MSQRTRKKRPRTDTLKLGEIAAAFRNSAAVLRAVEKSTPKLQRLTLADLEPGDTPGDPHEFDDLSSD